MSKEHTGTVELSERPFRLCLACDSGDTVKHGRALTCRRCEVTYFIPAVQLVRVAAHQR